MGILNAQNTLRQRDKCFQFTSLQKGWDLAKNMADSQEKILTDKSPPLSFIQTIFQANPGSSVCACTRVEPNLVVSSPRDIGYRTGKLTLLEISL